MQTAETIIAAFESKTPVRIRSMKWSEFLEMLASLHKLHE